MSALLGQAIIDRGLFDPAHVNEAAVFAAWACMVATVYLAIMYKHKPGSKGWLLLTLGLIMPSYALRYVFFGTRWGSNSSFAMVNLLFTSFCPARILLPCPDSNPVSCHLTYPKMYHHSVDLSLSSGRRRVSQLTEQKPLQMQWPAAETNHSRNNGGSSLHNESPFGQQTTQCPYSLQSNSTDVPGTTHTYPNQSASAQQERGDLHFPVLVPLWQIYVRERPLPIFLHTAFMTIAALLWPLQLWKGFRQQHCMLHRRLGYLALTATALGSLSAAPYAVTYLLSSQMPETITGLGYLGMYSSAACFLVTGVQAARRECIQQHQLNMVRLVGLAWGVSPLGRILTVTPPIIWFTGPWNNAAVVCLSWPLGICLAQQWLLHDLADRKAAGIRNEDDVAVEQRS